QPPMKQTPQTPIFQTAVGQVCPTMCAITIEQPQPTLLVAKKHQILPHQPDRLHRPHSVKLFRQCNRLPVTPQQCTSPSVGASTCHELILFCRNHSASHTFAHNPCKSRLTSQ